MTKAFLIVSVACNVWFLFLLFYDRIMDMKLIRFFRDIAQLAVRSRAWLEWEDKNYAYYGRKIG